MSKISVSKLKNFTGHRDCIYTLERSSDPSLFFSGAGDGLVAKWNLQQGEDGQLIAQLPNSVYALHFYRPENQLIIGQNFEGIHQIDLNANQEIRSLKLNDKAIFDIQSHKQLLFAGTGNGTIFIVDVKSWQIAKQVRHTEKSARSIAVAPPLDEVAVAFSDNKMRIYDLNTFALKHTLEAHNNSVFTIKYSPDFRYLLSGSRDAHLKIWDSSKKYELADDIVAHMYAINNIDFSPDEKYFVTCSMDKSIKVWDARSFKLLKVIDKSRHAGHGTSINKLLWSDYNNLLLAASDDRSISVWDININL